MSEIDSAWDSFKKRLLSVSVLEYKKLVAAEDFKGLRSKVIRYFRQGKKSRHKQLHASLVLVQAILFEMDITMGHMTFAQIIDDWGTSETEALVDVFAGGFMPFPWKKGTMILPDHVPNMLNKLREHKTRMSTDPYTPYHVLWTSTSDKQKHPVPPELTRLADSFVTIESIL